MFNQSRLRLTPDNSGQCSFNSTNQLRDFLHQALKKPSTTSSRLRIGALCLPFIYGRPSTETKARKVGRFIGSTAGWDLDGSAWSNGNPPIQQQDTSEFAVSTIGDVDLPDAADGPNACHAAPDAMPVPHRTWLIKDRDWETHR